MNINLTCNAFWDGGSVNFYRQGGGCNNTGEIAAIFDHEWGHGMDDNDANGVISNPGEGIADIYMALRLKDSCVGRNFRNTNCGGYGNPCLACTGVREIDWATSARTTPPTTITWIDANCGRGPAPCGGGVHCEGSVYAESLWDLLQPRPADHHGYSTDTALEVATRTTYIGAGPVGNVFQCVQGCGRLPAPLRVPELPGGRRRQRQPGRRHAAHGRALQRVQPPRHRLRDPRVAVNAAAPDAPTDGPVVTATAGDRGAALSWTAVPGAVKYRVYRTDGVFGCDFGKVLLGETFGTTWSRQRPAERPPVLLHGGRGRPLEHLPRPDEHVRAGDAGRAARQPGRGPASTATPRSRPATATPSSTTARTSR